MTARLTHRSLRSLLLSVPLSLAMLVQAGCGSDGSSSFKGKHPGTEGGPCESGSCDVGLECLSNVCVDPNSGSTGTDGSSDGSSSSGTNGAGGNSGSTSRTSSGTSSGADSGGSGGTSSNGSGGSATDASGGSDGSATDASGGSGGSATDSGAGSGGSGTGGGAGEGGQVQCEGSHPIVNDQSRTCEAGSCYCVGEPVDTCFSADTVEACCEGAIRCGSDSEEPGVNCAGEHPIVNEQSRTCAPGSCYCSDGESFEKCLTEDIASICCPADIELDCVPAQ